MRPFTRHLTVSGEDRLSAARAMMRHADANPEIDHAFVAGVARAVRTGQPLDKESAGYLRLFAFQKLPAGHAMRALFLKRERVPAGDGTLKARPLAFHTWVFVRRRLERECTAQGFTHAGLARVTGFHADGIKACLNGRRRLTVELYLLLCLGLKLDPGGLLNEAFAEAPRPQ